MSSPGSNVPPFVTAWPSKGTVLGEKYVLLDPIAEGGIRRAPIAFRRLDF